MACARKAVTLYQTLDPVDSVADRRHFAQVIMALAAHLAKLGQRNEAVAISGVGVEIFRYLVVQGDQALREEAAAVTEFHTALKTMPARDFEALMASIADRTD